MKLPGMAPVFPVQVHIGELLLVLGKNFFTLKIPVGLLPVTGA
jgi:hypothetical protein